MIKPIARLSWPMSLLVAVVALGVLADGVVIVAQLRSSTHSQAPLAASAPAARKGGQHPCNHGFYVSQAAHAKKGGAYVKQIASGDLGKNGNCTAPLPAPGSAPKATPNQVDD